MVDKSEIKQITHVYCEADVNSYLRGGWVIVETAGGQDEDGSPIILYSLGKT